MRARLPAEGLPLGLQANQAGSILQICHNRGQSGGAFALRNDPDIRASSDLSLLKDGQIMEVLSSLEDDRCNTTVNCEGHFLVSGRVMILQYPSEKLVHTSSSQDIPSWHKRDSLFCPVCSSRTEVTVDKPLYTSWWSPGQCQRQVHLLVLNTAGMCNVHVQLSIQPSFSACSLGLEHMSLPVKN